MKRRAPMRRHVLGYVRARRALGFQLKHEAPLLEGFAREMDARGVRPPLDAETCLDWACAPQVHSLLARARRLESLRPFLRYLRLADGRTVVPPYGTLGPTQRGLRPRILSEADVRALLAQALRLRPRKGLRPHTYVTMLGLLACTGLRISEARHLGRHDVDLGEGVLHVREGKYRKSRLVPLHPSAVEALRRYAARRDALVPAARRAGATFFTDARGQGLQYQAFYVTLRTLYSRLGWCRSRTRGTDIRVHALRHTFAVRRLLRWHEEGRDVGSLLPALSTYMGHVAPEWTYRYLTGTPELMAVTGGRFERFARARPEETQP